MEEKKTALVTGASRGLGKALAAALAETGHRVVLVARSAEPLERVASDIEKAGGEAHPLAFDMGDKEAIHRIAGAAAALVGPVDLLIHNASSLGPTPLRLLLDTECEDLERVFQVNVVGPFRLSKVIAGSMAIRGTGTIVHVSSDAAVAAYPRWGAYGASKAALDHLSRILAAELNETGVRVLSVDPGEMDTAMHAQAIPDADPSTLARPGDVANRIIDIVRRSSDFPSGVRVEAQTGQVAA